MLLGVPGLTTRRKDALGQRCLFLGRRVCVCAPFSHRDSCDFSLAGGCQRCTLDRHQRRRHCCVCEINPGCRIDVPAWRETYVEHKLSTSCFLQQRANAPVIHLGPLSFADLHDPSSP